jgi:uncharacterized protein Yka (UPF0111/DUF47 family)
MSTAYLAVTDRTRPGTDRDDIDNPCIRIVGASRPSAVRALLARSITMTALSIERRIRTLRRRPNTKARDLSKLVAWHERQADRARQDLKLAKATGLWSLPVDR